jgi:hypothetical protein
MCLNLSPLMESYKPQATQSPNESEAQKRRDQLSRTGEHYKLRAKFVGINPTDSQ